MVAVSLLAAGCSRGGEAVEEPAIAATTSDFGDLKGVCQGGAPSGSPAQGVTAGEIAIGVPTDMGFTKKSELVDAAYVFTSWCNAAGGVNGRRLVVNVRDSKLMESRQRMIEACREDFALVGGGFALDGASVEERLKCLLPEFPAQIVDARNTGSDLQIGGGTGIGRPYNPYSGLQRWLVQTYPGSASAIGIIAGDSPATKAMLPKYEEGLGAVGGAVTYTELYPATGVADWTPYAQSIKSKGVRGLVFLGDFRSLAKLEEVLTGMDYKLDWIDANANAYQPAFIELAGRSVAVQNNVADLGGTAPLESADEVPAVRQVQELFARYAPDKQLTYPALRAFSSWLLFAKAAAACGNELTRRCVYEAAAAESAWTAGGLQAPMDMKPGSATPPKCFNIVKATPQGFEPADFGPDTGQFRCDATPYVYKNDYGKPATLADVGKSYEDFR
ncbi:ABC transporter substrate-binding protein [Nocardia farcinica]|uniref:ABC transporter substrate-binding protein n=1 Tax=Nocardia farcinica TaxID=37329 RepID=UPI003793663D